MSTTQGTMSIVSDSTSITLQTALQLLDTRFTALEHNIANTSTPGFLAQRVEFEDELSLAIANGDPTSARAETVTSADPVARSVTTSTSEKKWCSSPKPHCANRCSSERSTIVTAEFAPPRRTSDDHHI